MKLLPWSCSKIYQRQNILLRINNFEKNTVKTTKIHLIFILKYQMYSELHTNLKWCSKQVATSWLLDLCQIAEFKIQYRHQTVFKYITRSRARVFEWTDQSHIFEMVNTQKDAVVTTNSLNVYTLLKSEHKDRNVTVMSTLLPLFRRIPF